MFKKICQKRMKLKQRFDKVVPRFRIEYVIILLVCCMPAILMILHQNKQALLQREAEMQIEREQQIAEYGRIMRQRRFEYAQQVVEEVSQKHHFWQSRCDVPAAEVICSKVQLSSASMLELPTLYGNAELLDRCEPTEIEFRFSLWGIATFPVVRTGDVLMYELAPIARSADKTQCIAGVRSISVVSRVHERH